MVKIALLIMCLAASAALLTVVARLSRRRSGSSRAESRNLHPLVERLEESGYFRYVAVGELEQVRRRIQLERNVYIEGVERYFAADAESLCEDGVLDFLGEAAPFLSWQGVHVPVRHEPVNLIERNPRSGAVAPSRQKRPVIDDEIPNGAGGNFIRPIVGDCAEDGDHYTVTIGNVSQVIWNSSMTDVQCWEAGHCHTILILNKLLENVGSEERAYGLLGGNDGGIVFLTPEQYRILREAPELDECDRPWEAYKVEGTRGI